MSSSLPEQPPPQQEEEDWANLYTIDEWEYLDAMRRAAASGDLGLLVSLRARAAEWQRQLRQREGGEEAAEYFLDNVSDFDGCICSAAANGQVDVIDWIWREIWSGKVTGLVATHMTSQILINSNGVSLEKTALDRIRVLEWARDHGLLVLTPKLISHMACNGAVTIFEWLADHGGEGILDATDLFVLIARGAASYGHMDLLQFVHERNHAALLTECVAQQAVGSKKIRVLRWMVEKFGPALFSEKEVSLPAIALEIGSLDALVYLYEEICVPWGREPRSISKKDGVRAFYEAHADKWRAGLFPCFTIKPARD